MLDFVAKTLFDQSVSKLTPRLLKGYGWRLIEASYPTLEVVFERGATPPLRLRLTCDGWNDLPPSIALLSQEGDPIRMGQPNPNPTYSEMFSRSNSVLNAGPHEITQMPFVCMRGSREYHTHSSHRSDAWENYRRQSGNDLIGLVVQVCRAWKGARR